MVVVWWAAWWPLCVRTGMARSSLLCWLFILIRAGSSEPGVPSPGAAAGFAFTCIAGLRTSKGRESGWERREREQEHHHSHLGLQTSEIRE